MIQVENLKKHYGPTQALAGVSFEVPRGEVLGFVGPNGAGKTTTMKILTGFLYPDEGSAKLGGLDVLEQPLETKKLVGYLPESNPLYMEMSVISYLHFAADIRGVEGRYRKAAVEKVVKDCGLGGVRGKDIGELSKGYKQRVGLAQAMIHDPDILILDEPTSGLDPNQIVEIRNLIKKIGQERTVILSTHYLQEVEATCDRVIIIHKGGIVADGKLEDLVSRDGDLPVLLGVIGPEEKVLAQLHELAGKQNVERLERKWGASFYRLHGLPPDMGNEAIFDLLVTRNGWKLVELHRETPRLETIFRKLTGGTEEPVPVEDEREEALAASSSPGEEKGGSE